MQKSTILKLLQERLPEKILLQDQTNFDYSEDEFVSILSWIKCFNKHFTENGFEEKMPVDFAIVSKRLKIDFYFFNIQTKEGDYIIYLASNKRTNQPEKMQTVKELIHNHKL